MELQFNRIRFLIFLHENFLFTRMLHKVNRNIFETRERILKNIQDFGSVKL